MNILVLFMVLGTFYIAYAGECKRPQAVENFKLEKFAGAWVEAIVEPGHESDYKMWENSRCSIAVFHFDNGVNGTNRWDLDATLTGNVDGHQDGTYWLEDPNIGLIKLHSNTANLTYDMTVMCTDYSTYSVVYVCVPVSDDYIKDYLVLLVKDAIQINTAISLTSLPNCLKSVTSKSVMDLHKVPHIDCIVKTVSRKVGQTLHKVKGTIGGILG